MGKKICSDCGNDLTHIVDIIDYRFTVIQTAVDIETYEPYELIDYFCGLGCLQRWIDNYGKIESTQIERGNDDKF